MHGMTTRDIENLRAEAAAHGDYDGVLMCDRALEGDESAIDALMAWADDTRAMEDE